MVSSSQCIQPECDFTGIQCTNPFYQLAINQCSRNFITCKSGQLSPPILVGSGMACFNGEAIPERDCSEFVDPEACSFTGIRCVRTDGMLWDNKPTDFYVLCDDGVISAPIPVPPESRCFNNRFILKTKVECSAGVEFCEPGTMECVNQFGSVVHNSCTAYRRDCDHQVTTAPIALP